MVKRSRSSIDLRSQDLTVDDMVRFRDEAVKGAGIGTGPQELIMFSAASKPYQYLSLEDFMKDTPSIPDDTSYFYYTLTFTSGDRVSLYLDPDRPAKVVIEGNRDHVKRYTEMVERIFPKGGSRYKAQGYIGVFIIWGVVISIALAVILGYSLLSNPNPLLILWVIFISSMLGIYLSIYNRRRLNPANTMALGGKRRNPWVDLALHLITVAMGIVSVVLVIVLLEMNI